MPTLNEFAWLTQRLATDRACTRPSEKRFHTVHAAAVDQGWLRFAGNADAITCPGCGIAAPVVAITATHATLGCPCAETVAAEDVKLWRACLPAVRTSLAEALEVAAKEATYIEGSFWRLGDSTLQGGSFPVLFGLSLENAGLLAAAQNAIQTRGPSGPGVVVRADGPDGPIHWPQSLGDVRLKDMLRLDGASISLSPRPVFDVMPDSTFGPRAGGRPKKLGHPVAELELREESGLADTDFQKEVSAIHALLRDRYGDKAKTRDMVKRSLQEVHGEWVAGRAAGRS